MPMPNVSRLRRASPRRPESWASARSGARGAWCRLWVVWHCLLVLACGAPARDTATVLADSTQRGAGGVARVVDAAPTPLAIAPAPRFGDDPGFRSPQRLDEHFAKHGREFGSITREGYLRQAQALRDAPVSGSVLEVRRADGVVSRFDRRTGAFLAFDSDGIIRTFFRPNDGEAYFRRQARRRPTP